MEMYRRIHTIPTTESHRTLPTNFRTSNRELNTQNDFSNAQSNHVQPPNPIVIPKSIDHVGGRNSPSQININPTSIVLHSTNAFTRCFYIDKN